MKNISIMPQFCVPIPQVEGGRGKLITEYWAGWIVGQHTGSKIWESLTHLGRIGRLAVLGCIENPPVTLDGVAI